MPPRKVYQGPWTKSLTDQSKMFESHGLLNEFKTHSKNQGERRGGVNTLSIGCKAGRKVTQLNTGSCHAPMGSLSASPLPPPFLSLSAAPAFPTGGVVTRTRVEISAKKPNKQCVWAKIYT